MRRTWVGFGAAVAGVGLAAFTFAGGAPVPDARAAGDAPGGAAPVAAPHVEVTRPERVTISRPLSLPGTLRPFREAALYARVAGYCREISVDRGSRVTEGQVLAVLDVPEVEASLAAAEAKLAEARAAVERAVAERTKTEAEGERAAAAVMAAEAEASLRALLAERTTAARAKAPDMVSQDQTDEARGRDEVARAKLSEARAAAKVCTAALAAAEAARGAAEASVRTAAAMRDRAKADCNFATLGAPFAGLVTERFVHPGGLIPLASSSPTNATPIVHLVDDATLRLEFFVPEPEVTNLAVGRRVRFTVKELPGREFTATVARLAGALSERSRTMAVEGDVENPKRELAAGMFASVLLDLEPHENVLTVPAGALLVEKRATSVFVVADGVVKKIKVKMGVDDGDRVEILEGLAADATVVVAGASMVKDGDRVVAVPKGGAR